MSNILSPEVSVVLAGGCYVLGMVIINQVALRLMVLLGTFFYIWYYTVAAETPLWEAIYLSLGIGVANLIGLLGLYLNQSKLLIPNSFRDLYQQFEGMPPGDFRDLVARADRKVLTEKLEVTLEGQPVSQLTYVVSGGIDVEKRGDRFPLPARIFIGEVAFLTGQSASATTWVSEGAEILQWDADMLRQRSQKKPRFKLALEAMISKALAATVAEAVAPPSEEWRARVAERLS